MLATLPFGEANALSGTRHLLRTYPELCDHDRFASGINPTLSIGGRSWLSEGWFGLDQGLLVMMIENCRTEQIWKLVSACPYVRAGLQRANFDGGWL